MGRQHLGSREQLTASVLTITSKILDSKLTDWQKIEAVNLFALSKTTHTMSSFITDRTSASKLDAEVRKLIKKAFRLPTRTLCAFFHLPSRLSGLGLRSVETQIECSLVSRSLKTLSSKDRLVADAAWDQLFATIVKRTGDRPSTASEGLPELSSSRQGSVERGRLINLVCGASSST